MFSALSFFSMQLILFRMFTLFFFKIAISLSSKSAPPPPLGNEIVEKKKSDGGDDRRKSVSVEKS